jgi:glycosyltransferase involved in cell wall biosynthesis
MVLEVLRAVAPLREAVLVVVGDGSGKGRRLVQRLAAELGLGERIRFDGAIAHAQLPTYYAACDLFALPTLRDFPWLVVLEAQSCGRAVVTTRAASSELTVADGQTGVLAADLQEFRHQVAALVRNPHRREALGRWGPQYIHRHHTMDVRIEQVERMLRGECVEIGRENNSGETFAETNS